MHGEILDPNYRKQVFKDLHGYENKLRKQNIYHAIQIYKEKQYEYVKNSLAQEYDAETVNGMRKITSINIVRAIIHEEASIYKSAPTRTFEGANEREQKQLENLYKYCMVNKQLKFSNRYFKYIGQTHVQQIPMHGIIKQRVLAGYNLDVVPDEWDPEIGEVYIVPIAKAFDRSFFNDFQRKDPQFTDNGNGNNEVIADEDDDTLNMERFAVWTKMHNFICDGHGRMIDPLTNKPFNQQPSEADIASPLPGHCTFIDVSEQKDNEYWLDHGLNLASFAIEYAKILSDTVEINRNQGFATGVLSALEKPKTIQVGSNRWLYLKKGKNTEPAKDPEFKFENPSPDLKASIELNDRLLNLFLTARGRDQTAVNTTGNAQTFSSALERHLAMIEKFEATADDLEIYHEVEQKLFKNLVAWSNELQGTNYPAEKHGLKQELQGGNIRESVELSVNFAKPEHVQTRKDLEDSVIKRMQNGLMSDVEAVMELREIGEDEATKVLDDMRARKQNNGIIPGFNEG